MTTKTERAALQAQIDAGADPRELGMTYVGSIDGVSLRLLHPEIHARLTAGGPLTKRDGERLKSSPFLVQYGHA
jgi:hypothetical protein